MPTMWQRTLVQEAMSVAVFVGIYSCFGMLCILADVWVHIYHCDPYTGFLNRPAAAGPA